MSRPWGVSKTGSVRHHLERDRWFPILASLPAYGHRAFAACTRRIEVLDEAALRNAVEREDVDRIGELPLCAACERLDWADTSG